MTSLRWRFIGQQRWLIGLLAMGASAAAICLLTTPWPDTPDALFHLHRVRALAEALRWGVPYPRWFPDFAFGYGYPVLNFYAPAFYYPPALLHLAGLNVIVAVRVTLAICYALSGWATYALLRRWTRPMPAALGAILYLAYPYRLYDLVVRGALPEFAAFLWLPLIALMTVRWLAPAADLPDGKTRSEASADDTPAGPPKSSIPNSGSSSAAAARLSQAVAASLCWAGLILTHNLTALMAALAGLGAAVLWTAFSLLPGPRREQRGPLLAPIRAVALPLALGGMLSAAYALPALLEANWVGLSAGAEVRGYATHFSTLRNLFDRSPIYSYPAASQPAVPAPGYAAILLILAALALLLPQARGRRAGLGISAGVALGALWLSTAGSALVWDALAPALGKLQFPWRWQTVAALALACTLGGLLDVGGRWVAARNRWGRVRPLGGSIALILATLFTLHAVGGLQSSPAQFAAADLTPEQMWGFDAQHGQVGATWTGEFLPRWVKEQRWAIGQEPSEPSSQDSEPVPTPATVQSVRVLAQRYLGEELVYVAPEGGRLIFHAFYYPAWRVEVNGQPVPTRALGDLGLLAVDLPAGEHEITRRWGATPAVGAGRAGSAAAWLGVLGLLILARDRRRPLWIGLWLAVTAAAVVGGSGWLAREEAATPVGSDFGLVRLESVVSPPARAGETATVTLHWLVTATREPLTAFVHVLAADGRIVAGHDAPLGGIYTPAGRWFVDELLPDLHAIALPADLPPGVYQLKAGIYRPDAPDAPLKPEGRDGTDPRVDAGMLEVRP